MLAARAACLADGEVAATDPARGTQPHVHHGAEHRQQSGLRAGLEGAAAGRGLQVRTRHRWAPARRLLPPVRPFRPSDAGVLQSAGLAG